MQLRQSERKRAKIKLALQGSSGSGKTFSSLLLAKGLAKKDFTRVAIIDTENSSADLYAHLGDYKVLTLEPPFSPDKYIKAIDVCLQAGMEVIIVDSISHCWNYLLEFHSRLAGNSFANWNKIMPLQKAFLDKMLQADAHIIATMRTKQDYVLNLKDGKYVPEKVGMKAIQKDGVDYEFTLVFELDIKHFATCSKDRTGLFMGKPEFTINSATGRKILDWCEDSSNLQDAKVKIKACTELESLKALYSQFGNINALLENDFKVQKDWIITNDPSSNPSKFSSNGVDSNHIS